MKTCLLFLLLFSAVQAFGPLGFCEGSKGDAIFYEDFVPGTSTGSPLPPGNTNYTFVTGDPNDGQYTISGRIGMNSGSWHYVKFEILDETDTFLIKGGSAGNIHSSSSPQWEQ